jgi:hypothetical protein
MGAGTNKTSEGTNSVPRVFLERSGYGGGADGAPLRMALIRAAHDLSSLALFNQYALGYITASNALAGNPVKGVDLAGIDLALRRYCQNSPTANFVTAVEQDLSDTGRTPMKSRATAGIGPGANSKKTSNPTEDGLNNHLTR